MIWLNNTDADFETAFASLVDARREADADVAADVTAILARVRVEGDTALVDLTRRFDMFDLDTEGWAISRDECAAAYASLAPDLRDALNLAADRIRAYHEKQRPADRDWTDATGTRMGARWTAVAASITRRSSELGT